MKNMIYALTRQQVREKANDVTRRMGCLRLKPGKAFQQVLKCMGLRPGEKIEEIGCPVITVFTRREPLRRMIDDPDYERKEKRRREA